MMVLEIIFLKNSGKVELFFRFKLANLERNRRGEEGRVRDWEDDDGRNVWLYPYGIVKENVDVEFGETDKFSVITDRNGYQEYKDTENAANLVYKDSSLLIECG